MCTYMVERLNIQQSISIYDMLELGDLMEYVRQGFLHGFVQVLYLYFKIPFKVLVVSCCFKVVAIVDSMVS